MDLIQKILNWFKPKSPPPHPKHLTLRLTHYREGDLLVVPSIAGATMVPLIVGDPPITLPNGNTVRAVVRSEHFVDALTRISKLYPDRERQARTAQHIAKEALK